MLNFRSARANDNAVCFQYLYERTIWLFARTCDKMIQFDVRLLLRLCGLGRSPLLLPLLLGRAGSVVYAGSASAFGSGLLSRPLRYSFSSESTSGKFFKF
jgi:hypothetical protein